MRRKNEYQTFKEIKFIRTIERNMELSVADTQKAIKQIKTEFEKILSENLHLIRVSAPKFIRTNTGIQDDLAGACSSVKFNVPSCGFDVEIVHSLAKWKRIALQRYEIPIHNGLYTDMDAIRKDEKLDFMHSIYVDQWDWEMRISETDRNIKFLMLIVDKIYDAMKITENIVHKSIFNNKVSSGEYYRKLRKLPESITYIHSEELEEIYPEMTPKERENEITKKYGAVFLIGIGYPLQNGKPHDLRAFDYDNWSIENGQFHGLNGDILVWNDVTKCAFEISSMGIRVDSTALQKQAALTNSQINMQYHSKVLKNEIPLSIGGGIGQSRLCMFILGKHHIGEVQVSEWPDDMIKELRDTGIFLL